MKKTSLLLLTTLYLIAISTCVAQDKSKLNIIFIGNSITQGVLLSNSKEQAPPIMAVKHLSNDYDVKYANCGVSGYTTVDFLPQISKQFSVVAAAADTLYKGDEILVFSICLGTNDSAIEGPNGSPVSPEQYFNNLEIIITELHNRYPKSYFILHQPIWYSPNTHNASRYLAEGLARLQSYTPQLKELVKANPQYIFMGDQNAYSFFENNWQEYHIKEQGNSGDFYLHPNEKGAAKLGEFWAIAINKSLTDKN